MNVRGRVSGVRHAPLRECVLFCQPLGRAAPSFASWHKPDDANSEPPRTASQTHSLLGSNLGRYLTCLPTSLNVRSTRSYIPIIPSPVHNAILCLEQVGIAIVPSIGGT